MTKQSPVLGHRGLMIDMARMKERDDTYFRLVEQLHRFGFNALYLHFTDSDGCPIELRSHPELVSPYAMSQEILARLIDYAGERGIEVVPELESWGHGKWITGTYPQYACSTDPHTLAIGNEALYALLGEIYRETAGLFPSTLMHLGCDEAWWTTRETPPEAMAGSIEEHIVGHLNRLAEMALEAGKTPIMWGDMVLKHRDTLPLLSREIILVNWDYNPAVTDEHARALKQAGFRVLTGPALMCWSNRLVPARANFENTRRMARYAAEHQLMGMVTTVWLPQRYPPGVLPHAIAYAGQVSLDPYDDRVETAMRRFVPAYFGVDEGDALIGAFIRLCEIDNGYQTVEAACWHDREAMRQRLEPEARRADRAYADSVAGLAEVFAEAEPRVCENRDDFRGYRLLTRLLAFLAERRQAPALASEAAETARQQAAAGRAEDAHVTLGAARERIGALHQRKLDLIEELNRHWDDYRYPDHHLKWGGGGQSLMWWLRSPEVNTFGYDVLLRELRDAS